MTRSQIILPLVVSFGLAMFVILLFMPAEGGGGFAHHANRETRLRQLVYLLVEYGAEHNGEVPQPWQWHAMMDPWIGIDRGDPVYGQHERGDFLMLPPPWPDARIPPELSPEELAALPVLFEDPELHPDRTVVAFWDGTIRRLSNEEFASMPGTDRALRLGRQGRRP